MSAPNLFNTPKNATGSSPNQGTHLESCRTGNHLHRWDIANSGGSIYVYIDPPELSHQHPLVAMYESIIQSSLEAWESALGGKLRFLYTEDPQKAKILIQPQYHPLRTKSHCYRYIQEDHHIEAALLFLHIPSPQGSPQGQQHRFRHDVLQVTGHALGMGRVRPLSQLSITLTPTESETIQWLYHLPLPINTWALAQKFGIPLSCENLDELIAALKQKTPPSSPPAQTQAKSSPFQQAVFLTERRFQGTSPF